MFSDLVKACYLKAKLAWQVGSSPLAPPGKPKHGPRVDSGLQRPLTTFKGMVPLDMLDCTQNHRGSLGNTSWPLIKGLAGSISGKKCRQTYLCTSPNSQIISILCLSLLERLEPGKLLPFWNLFTGNQFWYASGFSGYPPPEVLSHRIQRTCLFEKLFVWFLHVTRIVIVF